MERYIDGMDVPPRYEEIVEEYRNGDLGNFVGSYCGHPVFSGPQEVIHPTSGEVVGYSSDIQVGRQKSVNQILYGEYMSGGDITFDELLERGYELLEKERRRRNAPLDMGWTAVKAAAASGAAGGLMGLFDLSTPTSVAVATAVSAIGGGLSSVYCRHRGEKQFRRYLEWLSKVLFDMEKTVFSVNLLAPDSLVDSDAQTGSADNRQASNVYFIGGVPVDQQQRFNSFWDQADEVLEEYGFTEWQGYRTVGLPELIKRILEDIHNNCDLDSDHKERIIFKVRCFGDCRSGAIKNIKNLPKELKSSELCQKYGIDEGDITDPDKSATDQIKQTDREYAEAFRDFIAGIREVFTEAKKESVQELLVRIYKGKSSLQGYFWGELSRALVANGISPYDESVAEPAQFITDIPGMMPSGGESPSKGTVRKLYEAFYESYSEKYSGMLSPEDFIDKLCKDISWSKMHNLIYRIQHPQTITFTPRE